MSTSGDHAMKPIIDAFVNQAAWNAILKARYSEGQTDPVTILPGHLAEDLRWREVGKKEDLKEGKLYVVDGRGLVRGTLMINHAHSDHLYRPAIAGLDYVEEQPLDYVEEQPTVIARTMSTEPKIEAMMEKIRTLSPDTWGVYLLKGNNISFVSKHDSAEEAESRVTALNKFFNAEGQ